MVTHIFATPVALAESNLNKKIDSFEGAPIVVVDNYREISDIDSLKIAISIKAEEYGVTVPIPVIMEIVRCESSFNHKAYNPSNRDGSSDGGLFQLNSVHDKELNALGLDKYDLNDNIEYAMILMKRNGTRDWYSSEHCWNGV